MTKHFDNLTVENHRCNGLHPRQYSDLFPTSNGEKSKPRFSLDSMPPVSSPERGKRAMRADGRKPPMRILLRNAKTMKFFGVGDRWTKDPKQAQDFRNGWWATFCAFTMNPRHLVIDYEFEDDRYNMHIPVLGHSRT
jgi:hypothetical protein